MLCIAYSADGVAPATSEFRRAPLRDPELANVLSQPVGATERGYSADDILSRNMVSAEYDSVPYCYHSGVRVAA
jgi:hypothetical protein